ncbi:alanine--tRNA ligase, partial [Streptomyces rubiginosohelvolus]
TFRAPQAVGVEGFGYLARERDLVSRIAEQLQTPGAELPDRIAGLLDRLKTTDRENQRLRQRATQARAEDAHGVLIATATAEEGADSARALATAVRDLLPPDRPGVAAVGAVSGGTAVVVVAVNPAARTTAPNASDLVKRLLNGRGGDSPDLAQGGGLPAERLTETLAAVPGLVTGA